MDVFKDLYPDPQHWKKCCDFFHETIKRCVIGGCRDREHDNEGVCLCPTAKNIVFLFSLFSSIYVKISATDKKKH
jgi:hypothetical protein